ncbi:MAG: type II toxin-antitoxin system death-on-curing family toxin [Burkholderiales bacterium]
MSAANEPWRWVDPKVLLAVHDAQLAEHGGAAGVRSSDLFESALARPRNVAAYGRPDVAELAASYGFGIARNHPFVDGNKRTAFVAVELFLALNGSRLTASDVDCVMTMLAVAAGELDEAAFAAWLRAHLQAR